MWKSMGQRGKWVKSRGQRGKWVKSRRQRGKCGSLWVKGVNG